MVCPACSADNDAAQKFCGECGVRLSVVCASCGTTWAATQKFCGECGTALADSRASIPAQHRPAPAAVVAERRTVSVMFADLVGFTAMSESRDPEEVRELLSRYFDIATTTVGRYGGSVEKFIGDAVMAVWGVPLAHGDDAERAVRSALDLVTAVCALGQEVGLPDLRLRAGIVTGDVAATIGAVGQGMVAGDSVNTASRIQSLAPPGAVWVDDTTRMLTAAAVSYGDVGAHRLKGKTEPAHLFVAERITAGVGGMQRVDGLEAGFTGRDRELLLVKELFHDSAEQRRARLVSVTGVPGIGKSRLAWEFFKYLSGVADLAYWHVGRCLSYGDGVAYWALAEVVRMRLRIADDDPPDLALTRLREGLAEYVDDPADREWLEPRVGILLGLDTCVADTEFSRDELFAAWRLFFARLSERSPVVILLEDMQWADDAFLDFLESLLDWSAREPLFILTLARPELSDRRPEWARRRDVTQIYLDPLADVAMRSLVDGLVQGLPGAARDALVARAEGVPLYAVETVRMLIDTDAVVPRDGRYEVADPEAVSVDDLDVPRTLQAVVAARIDGLTEDERRILYDAAVLGQSFTREGLAAVGGAAGAATDLDPVLAGLVHKEVVALQADARSPERGQYRFVQSVLRRVAYDTLSRRDRKTRHLAAAAYLSSENGDERAPIVASHLLDAADAVPNDADAASLAEQACSYLVRAADRAAALGATTEALRHYQRALALTPDEGLTCYLEERAGLTANDSGDPVAALEYFARARAIAAGLDDQRAIARIAAGTGAAMWLTGQIDEAIALMEPAFAATEALGPTVERADLAATIARCCLFMEDVHVAMQWCERAATLAEHTGARAALVMALNQRANGLMKLGRPEEAFALLRGALEVRLKTPNERYQVSTHNNLALYMWCRDPGYARVIADEGLDYARRHGDRSGELYLLTQVLFGMWWRGDWDGVEALAAQVFAEPKGTSRGEEFVKVVPRLVRYYRGDAEGVRQLRTADSAHETVGLEHSLALAEALELLIDERDDEAATTLRHAFDVAVASVGIEDMNEMVGLAVAVTIDVGELDGAEQMLDALRQRPVGSRSSYMQAQIERLTARGNAARRTGDVEPGFTEAERLLAELGMPVMLAEVQVEHAEWLDSAGRHDEARRLAAPAVEALSRVGAKPLLQRAEAVLGRTPVGDLESSPA